MGPGAGGTAWVWEEARHGDPSAAPSLKPLACSLILETLLIAQEGQSLGSRGGEMCVTSTVSEDLVTNIHCLSNYHPYPLIW